MTDSTREAIFWHGVAVKLGDQIKSIQSALGTAEEGENLVAVAREAHRAEQELAAIQRKAEMFHYDQDGGE